MAKSPPTSEDNALPKRPFDDADEKLYRRVHPERHFVEGELQVSAFAFEEPRRDEPASGMSFDRSSMRTPTEVVAGHPGFKIAAVRVADVPKAITGGDKRVFTFAPEHHPIPENPAHSEVRAYDASGAFTPYPQPTVRKKFREELLKQVTVLVPES